jgi:hypothetical protein
MPVCEVCEGIQWVPVEVAGVVRMRRCACHPAVRPSHPPGLPREFVGAAFSTYRRYPWNAAALAAAEGFLGPADPGRPDLYIGTSTRAVGSGKSLLAACLLNACFARDRVGMWIWIPQLLRRLQPARDDEDAEEAAALERRLQSEPLLVLDDLGAERETATDYTRRTLLLVHEARWASGHRTIWTSNLTLSAIAETNDDLRLTSRLSGRAVVVAIDGPDQRPRARRGED